MQSSTRIMPPAYRLRKSFGGKLSFSLGATDLHATTGDMANFRQTLRKEESWSGLNI
jgi:hypothetical protein